jgi:type IX secretion system PorP/SprF family membrane protein
MKKNMLYSLFVLLAFSARAQVLSYDFYAFKVNNMFNVNPAYTGKEEGFNIIMGAQTQNKGVSYANRNYMLGMHGRVSKKQALGVKIISDSRGAFQVMKVDLSYAYLAQISKDMRFSLGLSGGLLKNSFLVNRIDNFQSLDASDPTLTKSYYNTNQFVAGAGILYTYKGLDVSFSMPHIIASSQPLNGYINAAVFYTIKANDDVKITPWICYQSIPLTKNVSSLFLKGMYKDMVWVQAGYQTNKSFCAMFGVNIEHLSIGYGYQSSNRQFNTVTSGMHQLTFGFKITEVPELIHRILPRM